MNPFYNIDDDEKKRLLKDLEAITYEFNKNEEILKKIRNRNFIGIITEGLIQIIKTDYNGNRTIIEELSENDIFGTRISSLANNEYTVNTKDITKIIVIDYKQLIQSNNSNSYYNKFIKNILEQMKKIIELKYLLKKLLEINCLNTLK